MGRGDPGRPKTSRSGAGDSGGDGDVGDEPQRGGRFRRYSTIASSAAQTTAALGEADVTVAELATVSGELQQIVHRFTV